MTEPLRTSSESHVSWMYDPDYRCGDKPEVFCVVRKTTTIEVLATGFKTVRSAEKWIEREEITPRMI